LGTISPPVELERSRPDGKQGAFMPRDPDLTHAFLALMLIGSILLVGGLLFLVA
jgi:hypothetical protein